MTSCEAFSRMWLWVIPAAWHSQMGYDGGTDVVGGSPQKSGFTFWMEIDALWTCVFLQEPQADRRDISNICQTKVFLCSCNHYEKTHVHKKTEPFLMSILLFLIKKMMPVAIDDGAISPSCCSCHVIPGFVPLMMVAEAMSVPLINALFMPLSYVNGNFCWLNWIWLNDWGTLGIYSYLLGDTGWYLVLFAGRKT